MGHVINPHDTSTITNAALVRTVVGLPDTKKGESVLYQFDTPEEAKEYDRAVDSHSHVEFFQKRLAEGHAPRTVEEMDRDARQDARRLQALAKTMGAALVRKPVGTGIAAEYIEFETFRRLQADYQQAIDEGETHASALQRVGFQPCSVYVGKLYNRTDKEGNTVPRATPIRPLYQHEVGVRPNGQIVFLKDKLPGDLGTVVVGATKFDKNPEAGTILDESGAPMTSETSDE